MTRAECIEMAEMYEQNAAKLEAKYQGVRPAWVSTDVARAKASAERCRKTAERLAAIE